MGANNKLLRISCIVLILVIIGAGREQNGAQPRGGKQHRRHRQHRHNQPEQSDDPRKSRVTSNSGNHGSSGPPRLFPPTTTTVTPRQPWTDKQIVEELLKKYRFPDPSTNISVAVLLEVERVLNAQTLDDLCRLQLVITQKWLEPKLEYKHIRDSPRPVRLRSLSYVWNPSLSIENALSVLSIGKDSLKVFSGGVVEYVQRIQVITTAESNLHNFPFENRNCTLVLTNDDPRAIWSRVLSITLPQDHSHSPAVSDFVVSEARMREYRHVEICLSRCLHSWILWLFAPSLVLLLASWLSSICSCVLPLYPLARMLVSMTYFAAILFITSTSDGSIARANELTALEQWIIAVRAAALLDVICACVVTTNSPPTHGREIESQRYEQNEDKMRWMSSSVTQRQSSSNGQQLPYYTQLMNSGEKDSYARVLLCQLASLIMKMLGPTAFLVFFIYFITFFVKPYYNKT